MGRAVTYSYSAAGYLTRATPLYGSFKEYGYDARGNLAPVIRLAATAEAVSHWPWTADPPGLRIRASVN